MKMTQPEIEEALEHQRQLHAVLHRNLQALESQAAQYGTIDVPLRILNEIQNHKKQLHDIETEISRQEELLATIKQGAAESQDNPRQPALPQVDPINSARSASPASSEQAKGISLPPNQIALPQDSITSLHSLTAFLCHSSSDKPEVRRLYHELERMGIRPWLDEEELLPGQIWEREIEKAVRATDVVIACLSRKSITSTGYVQHELAYALDVADQQPEGSIFIIPVRLEACEVPARLHRWHWVNLFSERGHERLVKALDKRAHELGKTPISLPQQKAAENTAVLVLNRTSLITASAIIGTIALQFSRSLPLIIISLLRIVAFLAIHSIILLQTYRWFHRYVRRLPGAHSAAAYKGINLGALLGVFLANLWLVSTNWPRNADPYNALGTITGQQYISFLFTVIVTLIGGAVTFLAMTAAGQLTYWLFKRFEMGFIAIYVGVCVLIVGLIIMALLEVLPSQVLLY